MTEFDPDVYADQFREALPILEGIFNVLASILVGLATVVVEFLRDWTEENQVLIRETIVPMIGFFMLTFLVLFAVRSFTNTLYNRGNRSAPPAGSNQIVPNRNNWGQNRRNYQHAGSNQIEPRRNNWGRGLRLTGRKRNSRVQQSSDE